MKLYLIRHGESVANAANIYQAGDAELTEKGKSQAEMLAKRAKNLPVEVIFASTMKRAKDTADIIASSVGKEVIATDLLRELKRPKEVLGRKQDAPSTLKIIDRIWQYRNDPLWHYSDEENFFDFRDRVQQFLSLVEQRKEEHILCVTHGATLRMIVALMLMGDKMTPDFFYRFWGFLLTRNTGITLCDTREGTWHLLTWNDHAHLGQL